MKNNTVLYNTNHASGWADGYPLGNGRIGAMLWGSPCREIASLNHDLLWRRYLRQPVYGTSADRREIGELCGRGLWEEAEAVMKRTVPSRNAIYINPFVPAFDQYITLFQPEEEIDGWVRKLDLETGVASVTYELHGVRYTREAFCDSVNGNFVTHLSASIPGMLTGALSLSRIPDCECTVTGGRGRDAVYCEGCFEEGVRFAAYSRIIHRNGRLTGGKPVYGLEGDTPSPKKFGLGYVFDRDNGVSADRGTSVCFDSCDEVWIVTSVSVDNESADPVNTCRASVFRPFEYSGIKAEHEAKFSSYFNRTSLKLTSGKSDGYDINKYLTDFRNAGIPSEALIETAFHMSRYIAISSGMPKNTGEIKAPVNLQGIWNRDTRPAWESDYHLDLNIEMCYWPMPSMGLADFMEPYLEWMERLLEQAKNCARDLYGSTGAAYNGCCDFQTHGSTDVVGVGALGCSAWLVQILWMYYEHMPSEKLLDRILVLMWEIDRFYRDMFVRREDGTLTFPFGSSPEMSLLLGEHRQWLSSPSAFDLTLVREFYTYCRKAAELTGDCVFAGECEEILANLAEPVISEDGVLREWTENHTEGEAGHRHRSPFAAFCPGTLYTKHSDPVMTDAMEKLLEKRLAAGNAMSTSFSYVWDAQIFARLGRGNDALGMLETLLRIHALDNMMLTTNDYDQKNGGIAWFTGVKVVQVEAQLAFSAALTEMFWQDQKNVICLLPALPEHLPEGSLCGIRGRRGTVCSLAWSDGKLSEFSIRVQKSGEYSILPPPGTELVLRDDDGKASPCCIRDGVYVFTLAEGKEYRFV